MLAILRPRLKSSHAIRDLASVWANALALQWERCPQRGDWHAHAQDVGLGAHLQWVIVQWVQDFAAVPDAMPAEHSQHPDLNVPSQPPI